MVRNIRWNQLHRKVCVFLASTWISHKLLQPISQFLFNFPSDLQQISHYVYQFYPYPQQKFCMGNTLPRKHGHIHYTEELLSTPCPTQATHNSAPAHATLVYCHPVIPFKFFTFILRCYIYVSLL